jgi:predicted ATPase
VRYFTGRAAVLDRISTWLAEKTSRGKAVVVTGGPGTGKSAILARLVTDGIQTDDGIP